MMLDIPLHVNNMQPMFEKWPHAEQTRWLVKAAGMSLQSQPVEFRKHIREQYQVVATIASQAAITPTRQQQGNNTTQEPN